MPALTRDEQRINSKHVLEALHEETGSWGGDIAAKRVQDYCDKPLGADTKEFGYVGGLELKRWYVESTKPTASERRSLWQNITERMKKPGAADPGGWDGSTLVMQLQQIAEEA